MKIAAIIDHLESQAPPILQESYDNTGLLTGDANWECTGVLCALDSTEALIEEAIQKKCNLQNNKYLIPKIREVFEKIT